MVDSYEISKKKFDGILELSEGYIFDEILRWKEIFPQYTNLTLSDVVELELQGYIEYLGTYCNKITNNISYFMEYFFEQVAYGFETRVQQLKYNDNRYTYAVSIPDSLHIQVRFDNYATSQSYETHHTQWLYETYHNYGMIFLSLMDEDANGKAFKALCEFEHNMKCYIRKHLEKHEWLDN